MIGIVIAVTAMSLPADSEQRDVPCIAIAVTEWVVEESDPRRKLMAPPDRVELLPEASPLDAKRSKARAERKEPPWPKSWWGMWSREGEDNLRLWFGDGFTGMSMRLKRVSGTYEGILRSFEDCCGESVIAKVAARQVACHAARSDASLQPARPVRLAFRHNSRARG